MGAEDLRGAANGAFARGGKSAPFSKDAISGPGGDGLFSPALHDPDELPGHAAAAALARPRRVAADAKKKKKKNKSGNRQSLPRGTDAWRLRLLSASQGALKDAFRPFA